MPSSKAFLRWLDDFEARGPDEGLLCEAAALDDGEGELGARFRYARATALRDVGRPFEALPLLASCVSLARDGGDPTVVALAENLLVQVYADTGDSASALALRASLAAHAEDHRLAPELRAESGQRAVRLGLDTADGASLLDALDALDALGDDAGRAWVLWTNDCLRALVCVRLGDLDAADEVVARLEARDPDRAAGLVLDLAQAAARAGENGRALRWARTLLERPLPPLLRDATRLCAGIAAWHSGRYEDAAAVFDAVVVAPDACPEDAATARVNRLLLDMTRGCTLGEADVAFLFSPEAERTPHASVLFHARGQHLLLLADDATGALSALDTALALTDAVAEPAHAAETRSLRALALAALGRHDDAAVDLAAAADLAAGTSEVVRARVAQLRAYATGLRGEITPEASARVAEDFAEAERGFARVGRGSVAAALRVEQAYAAAERGATREAFAHVDAALDDPTERPATWLVCARRAQVRGHFETTQALCDAVLAADPPADEPLRRRAALYATTTLAATDPRAALAAADAYLAGVTADDPATRQLRISRVGMLLDLGRPVSDDDRAFVLDDERLTDVLWPDVLRAVRASVWLKLASSDRAKAELTEIPCDTPSRRGLVAHRHALLAQTYAEEGRLEPARESLRLALDLAPRVPPLLLPPLLLTAGRVHFALGEAAAAVASFESCIAALEARGVRNVTWQVAQIQRALACAIADTPQQAEAFAALEALAADPALADDADGVLALAWQTLGLLTGDPGRVLAASRRFESRGDLLASWNAAELAAVVAGHAGDEALTREALDRAVTLVEALRAQLPDGPDRAGLRRAVGRLACQLATLLALDGNGDEALAIPLRTHGPGGNSARAPIDLDAIAAAFPPDALAVEYLLGDDALLIAVLDRGDRILLRVPWTDADADALALVSAVGALVSAAPSAGDLHGVGRALSALSARLIHPLGDRLARRTRLAVAAGMELGAVPFAALTLTPEGPTLLEAAIDCARLLTLSQAVALGSLVPQPGPCVLLRGDDGLADDAPLPFADEELTRIEARLRTAGERVIRGVDDLPAKLADAALVHYAGHVRRRSFEGELRLCLFPPGAVWTSADLYALTLRRAPVVALSGCESGDPATGERDRVAGLVRPLFARGARAVVSSHWPLLDARAVAFMDAFYAAWDGGRPLERALGDAGRSALSAALAAGVAPTLARLDAANFHVYALPR